MRATRYCHRLHSTLVLLTTIGYATAASADPLPPQPSASRSVMAMHGLVGTPQDGADIVAPDLFTGSAHRPIRLDLPPGRRGLAPTLTLVYAADNEGTGWLGTGWDLELGAVERDRRFGLSYAADSFVVKMGSGTRLVAVGAGEYRAKIESDFKRVRKLTAADGLPYWEVTDRNGVRYLFGQASATRQDNPGDASQVVRWCLERVEDPDGNYYTVTYFKDQGAIYPDVISYTGSGAIAPSNTVKFWRDAGARTDVPTSYTTKFAVRTVYRLQSVEMRANGAVDRVYALDYASSTSTARSQLTSVRRLGADAVVGAGGVATGSALPAESFTFTAGTPPTNVSIPGPTVSAMLSMTNVVNYDLARLRYGDFNGDGRTDVAYIDGLNTSRPIKIFISNGNGFNAPIDGPVRFVGGTASAVLNDVARVKLADFNGDGRTDILTIDGTTGNAPVSIYLANPDGTFPAQPSFRGPWVASGTPDVDASRVVLADFDGDGKADILYVPPSTGGVRLNVFLSTGSGFGPAILGPWFGYAASVSSLARLKLGDFDGDGRTEIAIVNGSGQSLPITIYALNSAGTGFDLLTNGPSRFVRSDTEGARIDAMRVMTGDVNGDGKTDFLALEGWGTTAPMSIYLATGTGFASAFSGPSRFFSSLYPDQSLGRPRLGDFNGDGKTDIAFIEGDSGSAPISIYLSEGYRYAPPVAGPVRSISGGTALAYELQRVAIGDFDGDGRIDFIANNSSGNSVPMSVYFAQGSFPDLLATSSNGIGRTATVVHGSSSAYSNTQLPVPRQVVGSVTLDDGNGVIARTTYAYAGGYYHFGDREFRGFNRVDVTGPAGPNGEQAQTQYSFHQGNDAAVDVNDPSGAVGYLQGKPYRVRTKDLQQFTYSEKLTTYWAATAVPYFAPVRESKSMWCEEPPGQAVTCGRSSRTTYADFNANGDEVPGYDAYGNVTRENQYGDEGDLTDDRTIVRRFSPNPTAWIVAQPKSEDTYSGAGSSTAFTLDNQIAGTSYLYDGTLSPLTCASAGSSDMPIRGHVTKAIRLLKGGTDSEDWTGYDAYGNVVCTSDADRSVTSYAYDSSGTFRTTTTNAKGHVTSTQYYGVDGVLANTGRYGQPKKATDPNLIETSFEYDTFGRKTKETKPAVPAPLAGDPYPGFTITTSYYLGGVGTNRVETVTSAGQWTVEFFDGLGRMYLTKKKGSASAAARVIATKTVFNPTGTTLQTSIPYDEATGNPRWVTFSYDAQKRVTLTTKPDGTRAISCHRDVDGSSVTIDANGHRRRQVADVRGNIVRVQEYLGAFVFCAADEGTPYATTLHVYDRMSRLTTTIDATQNQWVTDYDTLGRKKFASDPDLGTWYYGYTAAGDMQWQQDANGAGLAPYKTYFSYDELHRLTLRDYPTGVDESFSYDDPAVPYSKGQRTSMTDASGATSHAFDAVGRPWRTVRTIDGTPYSTTMGYDDAGRLSKETYPDPAATAASYQYDADGFLWKVTVGGSDRAMLAGYNVLGQVGTIAFGNGVNTQYTYNDAGNNRLHSITTSSAAGTLLSLTYGYDNVRNIVSITDGFDGSLSPTFGYDELNRLTSASSAALGALAYSYSAIGNVLSKEGITYTYDPVKVHAVRTTSDGRTYDYDSNGNMKSDGTRVLQYDYLNRPVTITAGVTQILLGYDGDGHRVKKQVVSGATTLYVGRLYECTGGTCTKHVFAGEKRIALIASDGAVRYHQADHLGSTRVVTDGVGALVERISYRPYGESGATATKYLYTSKELDTETGLYFYGARYYNASLARFVTPDVIAPDSGEPQTLNRYSYAKNNPIFYVDPSGWAETPAMDPLLLPLMMKADYPLTMRILGSNNYSPFAFEQQLNSGEIFNPARANAIRGLAAEAETAAEVAARGFLVFNPHLIFPSRVAGSPYVPDIAAMGVGPGFVLTGVVTDRRGTIDDVRLSPNDDKMRLFVGLMDVKGGHEFDASKPGQNGVGQADVNALVLRLSVPSRTVSASVLVVDQAAWEGLTDNARAKTFDRLIRGAYIYPSPGLADRADARVKSFAEGVKARMDLEMGP
jgi:RHS repeat-associated protein